MTHADTVAQIRAGLASLEPLALEIIDESALHAGHPGARSGGGHFSLKIVSKHFTNLNPVERHRRVYQALGTLMGGRIHALSITALAPEEL